MISLMYEIKELPSEQQVLLVAGRFFYVALSSFTYPAANLDSRHLRDAAFPATGTQGYQTGTALPVAPGIVSRICRQSRSSRSAVAGSSACSTDVSSGESWDINCMLYMCAS